MTANYRTTGDKTGSKVSDYPLGTEPQIRLPDGTRFTLPDGMRVAPFRLADQPDEKGKYAKRPYFSTQRGEKNWRKYATADPIQIQKWVDTSPDVILQAIYDKGFIVDADRHGSADEDGLRILRKWDKKYRKPQTLTIQTPSNEGQKRVFRMPQAVIQGRTDLRLGRLKEYPGIEILKMGILWGHGYKTLDPSLPAIAPPYLREIVQMPKRLQATTDIERTPEDEVQLVTDRLERLAPWRADDYESWIKVGLILKQMQDQDAALRLWHQFSWRSSAKYNSYEADMRWETFQPDGSIGLGSLIYWAEEDTASADAPVSIAHSLGLEGQAVEEVPSLNNEQLQKFLNMGEMSLSDWGNAQRLQQLYGKYMRYNRSFKWVIWNGRKWMTNSPESHKYAQATARSISVEASKIANDRDKQNAWIKWAKLSLNSYRLEKMLEEAKTHLYADTSEFDDNHRWLLNVENGVLDLQNRELLPHNPDYRITKMAGTHFDPEATAPKWESFIEMILPDESVRSYVQKAAGYSLTGNSDERAVYFLEGHSGNNGKSTFIRVLLDMFGEYGRQTDIEAIMSTTRGGLTPHNEDFYNVRFIATNELSGNMRFSTSKIKALTGNDRIQVNPKYRQTFSFLPTHHLWIFGNHRPKADKMDDPAFWGRMRQIVFDQEIPEDIRRPMEEVLAEFRDELAGILNWSLDGLELAQSEGMTPPERIVRDTQEYQKDSDYLNQFIEQECELGPRARIKKKDFLTAYNEFLRTNGEEAITITSLTRRLGTYGIETGGSGKQYYMGIGMRRIRGTG